MNDIILSTQNGEPVVSSREVAKNFGKEHKDRQIAELTPKGIFADAVSASKKSILVGELAKLLCQNGVQIG